MALEAAFEEVLAAARSGAEWAVTALYRSLHPPLLAYLRALEPADAEDLASDVWLGIGRNLTRFEGDEAALRGWAFTIARRRIVDLRRGRGRRQTEPVPTQDLLAIAGSDDPEAAVLEALAADDVRQRGAPTAHTADATEAGGGRGCRRPHSHERPGCGRRPSRPCPTGGSRRPRRRRCPRAQPVARQVASPADPGVGSGDQAEHVLGPHDHGRPQRGDSDDRTEEHDRRPIRAVGHHGANNELVGAAHVVHHNTAEHPSGCADHGSHVQRAAVSGGVPTAGGPRRARALEARQRGQRGHRHGRRQRCQRRRRTRRSARWHAGRLRAGRTPGPSPAAPSRPRVRAVESRLLS
jgi:hypothetical protein